MSSSKRVLVLGSGQQRAELIQLFVNQPDLRLLCVDVDPRADADIFCDAHDLPFVDSMFDAVITTAVVEHVLYPEQVASEIARVVKLGGLVYSELPFMQQVHEGPYDFTRFTLSGHRRLLNNFEEIDSGMVAGPATALVWAIEHFSLAFFSRRLPRLIAKGAVRLTWGWLKYLDYLLAGRKEAMDGASCTYFLGTKRSTRVSDLAIIERYVGAGRR